MIRKAKPIGIALALVFLCALPLMAQEPGGPPQGAAGGQGGRQGDNRRPPKPPVDLALDANGDGIIDASEIANAPAALKKLDTAGTGQLAKAQCLPQRPGGQGGQERAGGQGGRGDSHPLPPIFSALDVNGDGVISASEIAGASAALKKLDKNGDGKLTPD